MALDQLSGNEFAMGDHHFSLQVMTEPRRAEEGRARGAAGAQRFGGARARVARARPGWWWRARIWRSRPRSGRSCRGTSRSGRARRRSPAATSRVSRRCTIFRSAGRAAITGARRWRCCDHRALAVLLFAARLRSARGGRRLTARHRAHVHLRADRLGQDRVSRLLCGDAGEARRQPGDLRQGSRPRDPGAGDGRAVSAAQFGQPTGFNPLALPEGPQHREFLKGWLRVLASRSGRALTVREEADLEQALAGTLALPIASRRLSRLVEFLDATDAEGLHARLARWCASEEGEYAWVFDGRGAGAAGARFGLAWWGSTSPSSSKCGGPHAGDAVSVSPGAAGARRAAAGGVDGRVREAARRSGVRGLCARRTQDLAQVECGGGVCDAVARTCS